MEKINSARKQQMNIYSNRIKTSKKISNCAFYPVTPKQKTNLSIFDNEHDSKLIIRFLKANNCKQRLKKDEIAKLKIPDIQILEDSGVRGQTLSSKKNRWALKKIKSLGIDSVIDLREKYTSESYAQMCKNSGLRYYHFPINSHGVDDKEIIENFPLMFKVINRGGYYISCAQGLHRTDIALALNYVFNPYAKDVPLMYGHYKDGMYASDIIRRINSINKTIKDEDLKKLGWGENAREEIYERQKKLLHNFIKNMPLENYPKTTLNEITKKHPI